MLLSTFPLGEIEQNADDPNWAAQRITFDFGPHKKPAGRPIRPQTPELHLEKALTALALIFSLFQLNPAPFCLLDEVDAPLDDSNTERFCNLVKKMSRHTQFVFISHNKITMEMAQQLIGVTMQEQGVSRVVAVEIDEAVGLVDAVMVT